MKLIKELEEEKLIHPPKWLSDNIVYATRTGSFAYGFSQESSDFDIIGLCIPPQRIIFPHSDGYIYGFGRPNETFDAFVDHNIQHKNNEYDMQFYSIIKWFGLAMENNPNSIEIMYTPRNCVLQSGQVAEHIRQNRKIFLSTYTKHKYIGYAYAQLQKIKNKDKTGKRKPIIEKFGWDVKSGAHVIRLVLQGEQILKEGDLDLQRDKSTLLSIRRGEWKEQDVIDFFSSKEKSLNELYENSPLPHTPDKNAIKKLLLECLEMHYGSLDKFVHDADKYETAIREIQKIVGKI